jgi:hypothetical protein
METFYILFSLERKTVLATYKWQLSSAELKMVL